MDLSLVVTLSVSGQTWLQLQQQKLRAKREAQGRDFTDNFSRNFASPVSFNDTIHHSSRRSQTLSPVRGERNYHTISKTNSYSTNERPFVSVKRAHEQARQGFNSAPQSPLTVLNASPHSQISHVNHNSNGMTSPGKVRTVQNGLIKCEDEIIPNSPRSPSRNGYASNGLSAPQSPLTVLNASPHGQISHVNHNSNGMTSPGKVRTVQNGLIKCEDEIIPTSPRSPSRNGYTSNGLEPEINHHNHHNHHQNNNSNNNNIQINHNNQNNGNHNNINNNNKHTTSYNSALPLKSNNVTMNGSISNNTYDNNKNYITNNNYNKINKNDTPETIKKQNAALSHEVINGQLALDQLLASLALESDVTEQHLANLENGNRYDNDKKMTTSDKTNELSAVIATLTEFGHSIQNTSEMITNNWHMTRTNGHEMLNGNGSLMHSAIKRVHDMGSSECSSSISPSLSERSTNGVSWSDQAREESFSSSYRSDLENDMSPRPETPAFPVTPRTPNGYGSSPALPPKSPTSQRRSLSIAKKLRSKALTTKCHPKLIKTGSKLSNTLFQCVSPVLDSMDKKLNFQQKSASFHTLPQSPPSSPPPIFVDNPLHISKSQSNNYLADNDDDDDEDDTQSVSTLCEDKDPYGRVGSSAAVESYNANEVVSNYTSRRNSVTSNANSEPQEVAAHHVK
uniref:CSON006847 protein n=1 Tax=Culicoides sonorensis TaxID=179676 RepID=A0A336MT49_CULSO